MVLKRGIGGFVIWAANVNVEVDVGVPDEVASEDGVAEREEVREDVVGVEGVAGREEAGEVGASALVGQDPQLQLCQESSQVGERFLWGGLVVVVGSYPEL